VLYSFGWQVFELPYAVLAIPIAVSAFPALSTRKEAAFDDTAASSARAVLLASWLGAAVLAGAAIPASRLFISHDPAQASELALGFAAFAPGLVGYGLVASLSRVLLADGRYLPAGAAMSAGWLLVIAIDVIAVPLVPARWVVPVLGLGNSAGLTVAGLALLVAVRRARGGAALRGISRAAAAGLAAALAGAAAAAGISAALPVSGFFHNALLGAAAAAGGVIAFGAVAYVLDGGDLRAVLSRSRWRAAA
jgi:putative peptidoglycan lipid II flippase